MRVVFSFISLLVSNILGFALPALLAGWLFTLAGPVPFDQAVWLSLGVLVGIRYTIQSITNIPGKEGLNFIQMVISVVIAFVFLGLSGLFGWLLLKMIALELSFFEVTLLFAVSMVAGSFFLAKSITGGLPLWMTLPDLEDEDFDEDYDEEDYVVASPKRQRPTSLRQEKTNKGRASHRNR